MRKFKVQYSQVFEYELEAPDLDSAARSVQSQVQPDLNSGYIRVLSIEEAGTSRKTPCADCDTTPRPPSRIMQNWPLPKKKDLAPAAHKGYSGAA